MIFYFILFYFILFYFILFFSHIIESQNNRMAWVEKDHRDHRVSYPCYVQGRQPADQAAQSRIQPGLECLQWWGNHNLLGNLFQCITTLCVKNFLLISNLNSSPTSDISLRTTQADNKSFCWGVFSAGMKLQPLEMLLLVPALGPPQNHKLMSTATIISQLTALWRKWFHIEF